ncbi:hypothetical protein R0135_01135 [Congregibacter variabilis]|uniref:DUF4760 domain-containing protein n=1 Tax=Congregibacter variabilis TaxID=3081200 RepID=A0ABZ0I442_9GAMM|nr:hypothetical protein R0135_01135 [Congregibacter sp. IMCC43200]
MRKLTLSEWANIAEILGSAVVVLSLIFIGLELRQNTNALYTNSWQQVIDKMIDLDLSEASDETLGRVMIEGETNLGALSKEEQWRFYRVAQARLGQLEFAYLAKINGTLDEFHWGAMEGYLRHMLCMPGYVDFWEDMGSTVYHPQLYAYVEGDILNSCSKEK